MIRRLLFLLMAVFCFAFAANAEKTLCLCSSTTQAHQNLEDDQVTYTPSLTLTQGTKYKLTMKLRATEKTKVAIRFVNTANEQEAQTIKTVDVPVDDWTSVRVIFTADYDFNDIDFLFGGLNGSVYLDEINLAETSVGVNIVQNGDFADNSTMGWSTKTAANGTTFAISNKGYGAVIVPGEPNIPDTWEYVQQGDPNFHIYLAFGQSNMEGNAQPEAIDKRDVPERFKMMAAVNFSNPSRTKGNWYTAIPPLCRQGTGLTPCDYFGRYLVENLPEEVQVGVINVAVGGAKIELFMEEYKDEYIAGEADWFKNYCAQYNNDPLGRLVEMGKKAQQVGTIKGILLHQGESNNGESTWCEKVSKVYTRLCYYLGLNPAEVPLLAGETLYADQGGGCSWHNQAALPHLKEWVPNSYVISAEDIPGNGVDAWHFSAAGYRELGKRYGQKMLEILNEQAAGVEEVKSEEIKEKSEGVYNLSGQKLNERPQHGIFIENGKKIIK